MLAKRIYQSGYEMVQGGLGPNAAVGNFTLESGKKYAKAQIWYHCHLQATMARRISKIGNQAQLKW